MRKIIINMKLQDKYLAEIRQAAPGWDIVDYNHKGRLTSLKEAEVMFGWSGDAEKECLTAGTSLRWVQTWGAGVDSMPMEKLQQYGVILTNSSGVHSHPISETIFALILSFKRLLHNYMRSQVRQEWAGSNIPKEIHGGTIGIIGVGEIGKETARLAKAFGMKVIGLRRSGEETANVDVMHTLDGLPELLRESDYVVNTLPWTKETWHFMGREQFGHMKQGSFYINIGRGQTTDTEALLDALKTKQIAGAGLDVFEQEPLPGDHPLWQMDNVIITPHTSGHTQHYSRRVMDIFLGNLGDYIESGQPGRNRVDLSRHY